MDSENRKGISKTALIIGALVILLVLALIAAFIFLKPSSIPKPELLDGDGFYRSAYSLAEPVYP